ncbi:MAG: hypothetical protein QFE16_00350 [Pseudomonadota bacterium]|nr:hypothetical protein [Pseudomonadota bacterium]
MSSTLKTIESAKRASQRAATARMADQLFPGLREAVATLDRRALRASTFDMGLLLRQRNH